MLKDAGIPIAPSTYYAAKTRPPSARAERDILVSAEIARVHAENYGVYGVRKVWAQLGREGGVDDRPVARCTVGRLMKAAGLRGVRRQRVPRTTIRADSPDLRPDLVERDFTATAPNRLWVADIHLHQDAFRLGVCLVRHGRVLPENRGLAAVTSSLHRSRPGRTQHGDLDQGTQRCGSVAVNASFGPRRPIRCHSLH